jgi:Pentapeptide repeats (8 copies)
MGAHEPSTVKGLIAMVRIVETFSIKTFSTRRQGLHRPSLDLIGKARDENAAQVSRVGLTFLSTAAFCLLTLFAGDSALLSGGEKISVPLAGPVSFNGFMLLGPAVLIVLRVYLQIYVEHGDRLDRLARSLSVPRAPSLIPLQNPLIRLFSVLIFYLLLPVAMLLFAWKAAVFPYRALGLFGVAIAVIAGHVLLFSGFSWRSRALLSIGAAIIGGAIMLGFGPPRRSLDLERAKLSGHSLMGYDFRGANLRDADLRDTDLRRINLNYANLSGANLSGANLTGVAMRFALVNDAVLSGANLSYADLGYARLQSALLNGANLSDANLTGADLTGACGDVNTKLPEGLGFALKQCSTN